MSLGETLKPVDRSRSLPRYLFILVNAGAGERCAACNNHCCSSYLLRPWLITPRGPALFLIGILFTI